MNNNVYCSIWAASGECSNNPEYMIKDCAKSCENCGSGKNAQIFQEFTAGSNGILTK